MATDTNIVSWFQQNSKWIKTVTILLLIGFLILAITNAGCVRKQRDKFIRQTTILHILNDSLVAQNSVLQDSIDISQIEKDQHVSHIADLNKLKDSLVVLNNHQQKKLNEISSNIANMKSDSVYEYLVNTAYPDTGRNIYNFNEHQIRRIASSYFQTIALQNLVSILDSQLKNSSLIFMSMDSLVTSYKQSSFDLMMQNVNLAKIIEHKDSEITLYNKQGIQSNRKTLLFEITTAVASAIALIFAFK